MHIFCWGLVPKLPFQQLGYTWTTQWNLKTRQTAFCENWKMSLFAQDKDERSRSFYLDPLSGIVGIILKCAVSFQHQQSCSCVFSFTSLLCLALFLTSFWKKMMLFLCLCQGKCLCCGIFFLFFFFFDCSIFSLSDRPWKYCHSVFQMFYS